MRGDGSFYQRHRDSCPNKRRAKAAREPCQCSWEIAFYFRGKLTRERGGRTERETKKKLRDRIKAIRGDRYVGPDEERLTVGELLDALEQNLALRKKSVRSFAPHIRAMRRHFGLMRAVEVNAALVEHYQAEELRTDHPRANATINREIGVLRQSFRLAFKQSRISRVPYFPMLPEDNVREGFVEPSTMEAIATALPPDLADAARFAYLTGWRRGQVSKLRWEHVDRTNRLLLAPGAITKNGRPQTIPLEGELWDLLERRRQRREVPRKRGPVFLSPFVFHRGDGKQLGDFRKAWAKACAAAAAPDLLFHDLRRSGIRNMIRAGVDRDVAKRISGHRTDSMLSRYNVTDTSDQVEAFRRVQDYLTEKRQQPSLPTPIGGRK